MRRFFTMVEMLVVITIIAILASLLSPSLLRSLESARSVACLSALRQNGVALTAYGGDYKSRIPGSQIYGKGGNNRIPWTAILTDATPRMFAPVAGNYIGDTKSFYCPAGRYPPEGYRGDDAWSSWAYTYGMNALAGPWASWQGESVERWTRSLDNNGQNKWFILSAVPSPAKKPLVVDTIDNKNDNVALGWQIWEWQPDKVWDGWSVHTRHQDKANMWFADGHTAPVSGPEMVGKYDIKAYSCANGARFGW